MNNLGDNLYGSQICRMGRTFIVVNMELLQYKMNLQYFIQEMS